MLKVTAFAHSSVAEDVVERLHAAGVLEVTADANELPAPLDARDEARLRELDESIANAQFVAKLLGRYRTSDAPFAAFISEKIHLSEAEFAALEPDAGFRALYADCVDMSDSLASMGRHRDRLVKLIEDLTPWQDLRLQIERLRGTEHVVLMTGTVPAAESASIRQRLRDAAAEITVAELGPVGVREAWVVLAHISVADEARSILNLTRFAEVTFPELTDYPAEELERARAEIVRIDTEHERLIVRVTELAVAEYPHAVALAEAFESARGAIAVREHLGATERTVLVTGWVPVRSREKLEHALAPLDALVDVALEEPTDADSPPVLLENSKLLKPFETLTDLYGRPVYGELDPTILLAPFFTVFFAICIGDVGYGLMLMIGFYLIKTKLDVAPGVKRFSDLMIIGGAASVIAGIMFGSYFAIDFKVVTHVLPFLEPLQLIDPLAELQTFLLFTVALGVIQVFFGVLVAAYDAARKGDFSGAVNDQISTVVLAVMIAIAVIVPGASSWGIVLGLGISMLMKGHAIEAALTAEDLPARERALGGAWLALTVAWMLALAFRGPAVIGWTLLGATVLGLALSKGVRKTFVGILGGAYAVYGMSAFIGDILSYTRLAALGLSGTLVGMVFNLLAGLVWSGSAGLFAKGGLSIVFGLLVIVMAALVFVVGHVFNVVINLLGAFVHPARLQFVEFFSKFYEGGGRPYKPFGHQTSAVVLHASSVQGEGGTTS
ncbi:MAG: V-type ATP synthase subunit [Actinobacteria bacterium]|nr:MAG: V-type ATP synthase subunit [Actinomycetota bacterium]